YRLSSDRRVLPGKVPPRRSRVPAIVHVIIVYTLDLHRKCERSSCGAKSTPEPRPHLSPYRVSAIAAGFYRLDACDNEIGAWWADSDDMPGLIREASTLG